MNSQSVNTRNEALEFARRTRRNLEFIEKAKKTGEPVHVVTQLTISLLGLVVFPKEKLLLDQAKAKTLAEMRVEGWPDWTITIDDDPKNPTKTLHDLLRHVRNASPTAD
jgi:HEPN pEK499 p136